MTDKKIKETDVSKNTGTTPHYNEPEDAERYETAVPAPLPAHTVFKGDPQVDGPYLDDVHEAQAQARREAKGTVFDIQREKAKAGAELREQLKEANENALASNLVSTTETPSK